MTPPKPARPQPLPAARSRTEAFRSVEEAWFWTMAALIARRDGARIVSGAGLVPRPCEPDDVVKCLDRLYRQRRIDLQHARILRIWGERQQAPDPRAPPPPPPRAAGPKPSAMRRKPGSGPWPR